ncbi:gamma-glutamyl-gamma-aminobutyrate hydrolase family protein [Actinokineospora spheciospongiae]|uniref:gamma-glutamyl-gamma-aminobutyrate hydrolase family protein n=1 Tax=Actinokineospora spheciospongiae TaxID=909613 RepID=UPI000D70A9B8|nr:gamma-glutamyl-gamma-aminobutyrate hydrolase family protein [Actinokineospora spheciospongiae]PWW53754.1 putative glutamine amidotransferase [Actinokineospora spheciospongiae]
MASNGSDRPPVIGVTTYLEHSAFGIWEAEAAVLHRVYVESVRAAGGNAVLLPPIGDWRADTVDWLDGLVLSGGADIDPARYGQAPHPTTGTPQPTRDAAEFALVEAALELGLPLLAVCRGMQVLNVALGGTLHQHTPEVVGTTDHQPEVAMFGKTDLTTTPGSALAGILGPTAQAHCHHHQSLDRLGEGLVVAATAPDGTVEAVELTGPRFAVGVQSHPEHDVEDVRLFAALVEAARAHATSRSHRRRAPR